MSVNYSTNSSHSGSFKNCHSPAPFISYTLLPVFIFVLFVGYQRWRKQHSVVTATAMTSHSDIFTYNLASLEIFSVVVSVLFCFGFYTNQEHVYVAAMNIFLILFPAQTLFHVLTDLAVVHPVKYRGLRWASGVRIRNISIGCACGNKEQAGLKKKRAFYIIMTIMGTLLLRLLVILITIAMDSLKELSLHSCLFSLITTWLNQPSSLVSPLPYLYRAGKLCNCRNEQHR